jgi:hypothetical protein
VNGSLTAGGVVTATAAGRLGGTGVVYRSVVATNGGGFAPGDGVVVGSLTINGNVDFQAGATYVFDYGPGGDDRVIINGTLTLPINATVVVANLAGPTATGRHTLFQCSGPPSGASDLSGWTVLGMSGARLTVSGSNVVISTSIGTVSVIR